MEPFRASLLDDAGQAVATVEGSIQSSAEAGEGRQGRFEFQDTESVMQGVLDGKPFALNLADGSQVAIKIAAVGASSKPGFSEAEFSVV